MNSKSLKIYYLSSEIDPFSNTYSLAKFSKEFKDVESIKYFISPYEAFRYRAEFSLIGETGDSPSP